MFTLSVRRVSLICALAVIAAIAAPRSAQAALVLKLDDGVGNVVTITDGDMNDANPTAGVVSFIGAVGIWTINVDTVFSKPVTEGVQLDLAFANLSSGAGTMTLMATDTDYFGGADRLISRIGGTTDGTVTAFQFVGPRNAEFEMGQGVQHGPLGSGAFSDTQALSLDLGDEPYSITEVVVITHGRAGLTTGNINSQVVPAPAALPAGLALLGMIAVRRRTRAARLSNTRVL